MDSFNLSKLEKQVEQNEKILVVNEINEENKNELVKN